MLATSLEGTSSSRMSQYAEISIILVLRMELVSQKHETTSPVQNSVMGVMLSFLGQTMQEHGLGPTK